MKILLALVMSAALAPAAYAHPARDLTEAGIRGAVVLSHRGVDAAGDVTAQTRFRVGSITKTFVATVTLQLVAEGRLSLDEPVPEAGGAPLRTLLNHTSGIYNHSDDPRVFEHGLLTRWKPEQLIAISREHPPYFAAGRGLSLLQHELRDPRAGDRARHRPLVSERDRAAHHAPAEACATRPTRKARACAASAPSPQAEHELGGRSGAMVSTARDLARFYRSVPAVLKTGGDPYGFGLFKVQASCGVTAWGHNGAVPGFLAHAYVSGRRAAVVLIDDEPATERQEIAVNRVIDAALCS